MEGGGRARGGEEPGGLREQDEGEGMSEREESTDRVTDTARVQTHGAGGRD